ncbi:hypothetical protein CXG81DRAFT_27233 [Caulochytrium protostelioides]|uniref:Mitochondrial import inner membrane translocase subunit TIM16 n=1 Tax=Caulochytrium protostelioides TaxID=1555241 RepID=A0A4P9X4P9_9FUNG|nr:hypothetical protein CAUPRSCDRAFT_5857 [Caulochytrium protostelioides]RKP00044.1 hypothetical protein CXG81DRAFT_27233 [Caulochytrium protostelioides]|eukprot:RKP00044.1 hypothetical protein CXG81DRAFT_27233 [Caulochytrium protostelioides]
MSAPRIISQIVLVGGRIVGRAVMEAYRQAAAQSAAQRGAAAAAGGAVAGGATNAFNDPATRKTGMTLSEAEQILDLSATSDPIETVVERYERLMEANKDSSLYLQSKIVRARERIEMQMAAELARAQAAQAAKDAETGQPSSGRAAPPN